MDVRFAERYCYVATVRLVPQTDGAESGNKVDSPVAPVQMIKCRTGRMAKMKRNSLSGHRGIQDTVEHFLLVAILCAGYVNMSFGATTRCGNEFPFSIRDFPREFNRIGAANRDQLLIYAVAAPGDRVDLVTALLDRGVDRNAFDMEEGSLPSLATAIQCGNENVAKLLIARGADVNIRGSEPGNAASGWGTTDGITPLHLAVWFGHEELVRLLLARGANPDAQIIEKPADSKKRKLGRTPLMLAPTVTIADLLIKAHANVCATTEDGRKASDFAADNLYADVAHHLRKIESVRCRRGNNPN